MRILILEDNAERRESMRESLEDRFPQYETCFASTAAQMIEELSQHLSDTLVIALDHDLELVPSHEGNWLDPGTGRDVADYLATQPPSCPVIIHTTNSPAAVGMQSVLDEAGWKTARVLPVGGMSWIPTIWLRTLRDLVVDVVPVMTTETR